MSVQQLYINLGSEKLDGALVQGTGSSALQPAKLTDLVLGEEPEFRLHFLDSETSSIDDITIDASVEVELALGTRGGEVVMVFQDTWTINTTDQYRSAFINFKTNELRDDLGSEQEKTYTLSIALIDSSSRQNVVVHESVKVYNKVVPDSFDTPTPTPSFRTIRQSRQAGVAESPSGITGLTGGTSSDLDSLPTTGDSDTDWPAGALVHLYISGLKQEWRLESGTDAEDGEGIVRPDDFVASTNEKIWKRYA